MTTPPHDDPARSGVSPWAAPPEPGRADPAAPSWSGPAPSASSATAPPPPPSPDRPPEGVPVVTPGAHAAAAPVAAGEPTLLPSPPAPPAKRRLRRIVAWSALAALAMVGAGVVGALISRELDRDPTPPQRASDAALEIGEPREGALPRIDVAAVAEHVAPSVVTISADIDLGGIGSGGSIGTGVITTSDGEILTNAHVVEGATEIRVRLAGETEPREATLLAADAGNDLALLRVAGDDYQPATFADPSSIQIGDEVVAIGFALDLDGDPSVTLGIVSALDRTIITSDSDALDGLIQTDAAISSGNSGGPLVNAAGEVVGINTAVARGDATTAATNVGFAISVDEALPVVDSLREQADGAVRDEGYLGVLLADRTDGGQGAVLSDVEDDTPAADAGLEAGDLVVAVDGAPVDGVAGLVAAIRDREPGDELEITVLRDGDEITATAVLGERPDDG